MLAVYVTLRRNDSIIIRDLIQGLGMILLGYFSNRRSSSNSNRMLSSRLIKKKTRRRESLKSN